MEGLGWIAAIIVGGIAGWIAEKFMHAEHGLLTNIILGIVGAVVLNFILMLVFGGTLGGWLGQLIVGALGAMLLQSAASDPAVKTRQQALLAEAVRAAPAHRDVLRIARYYCDSDACRSQSPAHKLAEAEPDNAAHWVLLLERSDTQSEEDDGGQP